MATYIIVSVISGILFAVLDGLKNANPLARRLLEVYKPIARTSINFVAGMLIDLAYGFILAALFILISPSLPGHTGWIKGIGFGLLVWFLREIMSAISQWMMFKVPLKTVIYNAASGLMEMIILGVLYGMTL